MDCQLNELLNNCTDTIRIHYFLMLGNAEMPAVPFLQYLVLLFKLQILVILSKMPQNNYFFQGSLCVHFYGIKMKNAVFQAKILFFILKNTVFFRKRLASLVMGIVGPFDNLLWQLLWLIVTTNSGDCIIYKCVQWNLVITRSLGPWKLPCYIRFLTISWSKKKISKITLL